jgi:hypothetical protein
MLERSRARILETVPDDALVLDVGGWADPLSRADWVIDLMPYATRGLYQREGWAPADPEPERFDASTWIERDVCDRAPFPFADGEIDFAVCAHTLEDVRDPIWVCSELVRVARAGYIEVPSRLEEQTWGVHANCVGWAHHRWLIDVSAAAIEFALKLHSIHADPRFTFPRELLESLTPEERVSELWWEESFGFSERIFYDPYEAQDVHMAEFVARELATRGLPPRPAPDRARSRRRSVLRLIRR